MRSLLLLLAVALLLPGCTLTFPVGVDLLHRPAPGAAYAEAEPPRRAPVVLVTTDGRVHEGFWEGYRTGPDGERVAAVIGRDWVTRTFEADRVRGVHRPARKAPPLGLALLAGLTVDALLVHRLVTTCCTSVPD